MTRFALSFPVRFLPLAAVAASLALSPVVASAQQSVTDPNALYDRLIRLERDLQDVQRTVYQGGGANAGAAAGADMEASQAARLSLRLDQIEQGMRELRGQVEETQFQIRQVNQKVENFMGDTDFRLRELEGTGGGQRPQASQQQPQQLSQQSSSGGAMSSGQAASMGSLGTVSDDAVRQVAERAPQLINPDAQDRQQQQQVASAQPSGAPAGALPGGSADEDYRYAMSFLRQGDYGAAEAAFSQFLQAHGDSSLAGNAQYWLGETYYVREQYQDAARAFLSGYQKYSSSPKAPDSLLKLGITLAALGQTEDACLTLSEVGRTFPNASPSVKQRAQQERSRNGCA